jgi:hypothetical protein
MPMLNQDLHQAAVEHCGLRYFLTRFGRAKCAMTRFAKEGLVSMASLAWSFNGGY